MTDKGLWDAAWKEITLTTDSYPTWKKKGFPASSHFAKAKALGDQIGVAPGLPPFGTRPVQAAQWILGGHDFQISGKTITGLANGRSIALEGFVNVSIRDCDIPAGGGIYLLSCTGTLEISGCRGREIGRNLVQLDKCTMSGPGVHDNRVLGGQTEDIVSVYQSGGPDAAQPLTVRDNQFEGTDWISGSGSGIMTETYGHVLIVGNSLLNPGQVGIGVHGPNVHIRDNVLYSDGKHGPIVRVGVDCADGASAGCEVSGNKADWRNSGGGYEPYSTLSNPYPKGWAANDWAWRATAAEIAAMRVVL